MRRKAQARFAAVAPAAVLLAALALAVPRPARADASQTQSFRIWSQMNACARLAAQKFPDHTPEGNAQREAYRQNCLRERHLPVVAVPPPQAGAAQ